MGRSTCLLFACLPPSQRPADHQPAATCLLCFCSDSSYCSNAIGLLALDYSSQIGVVLAILGINMLLAFTSRHLTLFEKHHTRSSEARTLAHRLFLAQVRLHSQAEINALLCRSSALS